MAKFQWLTDTHCHLNLNAFQEDLEPVLERAWEQGIERILVPGIDLATSRAALRLAERFENVYAAVGFHPHDAKAWDQNALPALRDLAAHPKTAAIGEIGLDYYRDQSPRDLQVNVLRAQLDLAAEVNKPVVLHNREAFDDLWAELSQWAAGSSATPRGVFHSFDGTVEQAAQAVEAGYSIGISGPVTFKNAADRHAVARSLPFDRILIETDAPYLTPQPFRGRRNEPAYVAFVAEKLGELHGLPLETVLRATCKNAEQLFHWGASC